MVCYCWPKTGSISSSENSKTVGTVNPFIEVKRASASVGAPSGTVFSSKLRKKTKEPSPPVNPNSLAHSGSWLWTNTTLSRFRAAAIWTLV